MNEHLVVCVACVIGIAFMIAIDGPVSRYINALERMAKREDERPRFTCPRCGAVSYNPNDIRERYCGRCHVFVDDEARAEALLGTKPGGQG